MNRQNGEINLVEEGYIQEWVDTSQTGGEKRKSKEGERIEKNSGEKEKNRETWDTNVLGEGETRENQRFLRICHRYEAELVSSMPSGKKCCTLSLFFQIPENRAKSSFLPLWGSGGPVFQ